MTKHIGITIRIGAAHDTVSVHDGKSTVMFDRNEMRKSGQNKSIGALRRTVVDEWKTARAA